MTKQILISDIKIDRELRDGDDLSDLDPSVVSQPIVVQGDRLVDGLRRVELAKKMGLTELEAHDPQTLEEAAEVLALQHKTPLVNWLRVYELMKYLKPLLADRTVRLRAKGTSHLKHSKVTKSAPVIHSRILYRKAFGGLPSSQFNAVIPLFERHDRDAVMDVLNGKITPHGALTRYRRKQFQGRILGEEAQLALLNTTLQNLRNLADSMWMLGTPIEIDTETVTKIIAELRKTRGDLSKAINRLEEAMNT
jgi:hypothetical protein